jgi:hypothetical protein
VCVCVWGGVQKVRLDKGGTEAEGGRAREHDSISSGFINEG